jgi:hyaluronoglucosaminidase
MIGDVRLPGEMCVPDGYVLRCARVGGRDVVICAGYDARGCYYGLQTLIQLLQAKSGTVSIPRVNITDWPTFRLRLVKTSPGGNEPANVARWADMMPRFKMNVLASQFQPVMDSGTWREPSKAFVENTEIIALAAREKNTYDAFLYYGPFGKDRGSLLDTRTVDDYIALLDHWVSKGYTWIGIDFNDWYTERKMDKQEREKFVDVGEAMIFLTSQTYHRLRAKHPGVQFACCPCNGHYKDATPEVVKFCRNIPQDIMVISAGARIKAEEYSSPISESFLKGWAQKTGRKPFFWDNCIYRQLDYLVPFVNRVYNLDSYDNRFPPNMADLVTGIHLNGGAKRSWEPGVLTYLDYLWNPEAYNAEESLRKARTLLWGAEAADVAAGVQKKNKAFYEYLAGIYSKSDKPVKDEAESKLAEIRLAVDRLKSLVKDRATRAELDGYVNEPKRMMERAFAPKQQPKRVGN